VASLEQWQEIANRGIQDKLSPERRARFDEISKRGLISVQAPVAQAPQEQSFLERSGERLAERGENIAGLAGQMFSGEINPSKRIGLPSFAEQSAGQVFGGALDVVGEGISSGISAAAEAFPEAARTARGGMAAFHSTDIGRSLMSGIETVGQGLSTLEEKYPKQMGELGAAANILTGLSPLRATRAGRAAKARTKREAFTDNLILRNSTPTQMKELAGRSRQVGKKVAIDLTDFEKAVSVEVGKLRAVKPKNTLLRNQNVIQSEITKTLGALDKRLAPSKVRINRDGISKLIDFEVDKVMKANVLVPLESQKRLKAFAQLGKDILDKHPNTPAGLLKARREFDRLVKDKKKTVFDTPEELPLNDVVRSVRSSINDIIDKSVPDLKVRASLDKSHKLIDAVETMIPKSAKEIAAHGKGKIQRGAESLARFAVLGKVSSVVRKK